MKKKWESKAKEVYQEGLKLFKEGVQGLEVMAGKTLEVGKIKLANQQALNKIRGLFGDLGQRVYDLVNSAANSGNFKVSPEIINFVEQIKKLQNYVESNIRKLKHLSTVEQTRRSVSKPVKKAPAKKAVKAKKKPAKKVSPAKKRSK